jgi:dolichol-phosphate mannosyltransferase
MKVSVAADPVQLSVIIPAHNESSCIGKTVGDLYSQLQTEGIPHEILVIDDNSSDDTEAILTELDREIPSLRPLNNPAPNGFGLAVRYGLENFTGEAVAIYMADGSDSAEDLIRFYHAMKTQEVDCVFGSRFVQGGRTVDYPLFKLILNRLTNTFIRVLFGIRYNDVTNAFKLYRRHVIDGLRPLLSHHFNLTVELPLKAIVRGYNYVVVPNSWVNRDTGESKLKIKEMGSRYLFVVLYCLIEKWLSRGDYHRATHKARASRTNTHHFEKVI